MGKIILAFGHLPLFVGGKQSSGLANVQWFIANNINKLENTNYKVIFAATDIHKSKIIIDKTLVIGWSLQSLIKFLTLRPHLVFYYLFKTCKLKIIYQFPFWNLFFKLIFYHKTIKKINPDYIHLHGCGAVIFFEILGINKFKIFATIHGLSGQDKCIPGYNNYRKMEQTLNRLPFKFVAFIATDLILQWNLYYGNPNWPMKVILNSYDSDIFYFEPINNVTYLKKEVYRIATIASISHLKGQFRVLEALAILNCSKFEYICIGEGTKDKIKVLENFAKEKEISFSYLGYCKPSEINKILRTVDFMLLPSSSVGFGLVFLEFISFGVVLPAIIYSLLFL